MKIILYFKDGQRIEFVNCHSFNTNEDDLEVTYTDLHDCCFHHSAFKRDLLDRVSVREVSL